MSTTAPIRVRINGRGEVSHAWRTRTPFVTPSGNLTGMTDRPNTLGWLPDPFRTLYREQEHAGRIVYTVMSYNTPIAWVLDDGTEVIPPVRYSVTTSKHQGKIY